MTTMTVTALLTIVLTSGVGSQALQDFSGTWIHSYPSGLPLPIEGRGNSRDGQLRVGPGSASLVISHKGDRLQMEEHRAGTDARFGEAVRLTPREYGLNGQPVKSPFVVSTNAGVFVVPSEVRSKWQENTLVSTIDVFMPGEELPRHYIETLSISPEGILAVRIQRVGTPDSRTMFYKKAK